MRLWERTLEFKRQVAQHLLSWCVARRSAGVISGGLDGVVHRHHVRERGVAKPPARPSKCEGNARGSFNLLKHSCNVGATIPPKLIGHVGLLPELLGAKLLRLESKLPSNHKFAGWVAPIVVSVRTPALVGIPMRREVVASCGAGEVPPSEGSEGKRFGVGNKVVTALRRPVQCSIELLQRLVHSSWRERLAVGAPRCGSERCIATGLECSRRGLL